MWRENMVVTHRGGTDTIDSPRTLPRPSTHTNQPERRHVAPAGLLTVTGLPHCDSVQVIEEPMSG
jgi:hypothetical protein